MARIRTVKPEFFTSPDIAQLSFPARQLFQAMWCWADDFGIGETNLNGLLGFAFPDSDGFTAEDLRRFCAELARVVRVEFYEVRGRYYYSIPSWDEHQKTERRSARRKNPPQDDQDKVPDLRIMDRAESAPDLRGHCGANPPREQGKGNRGKGTGEQEHPTLATEPYERPRESKSVARMNALNETATTALARDVAASFNRWADNGIDSKTQAETAIQVDQLLADGIDPHQIADGLKAWHASDSWSPSQIRRFVSKAAKPANTSKPTKATLKAVDITAMGAALIAEFEETA